MFKSLMNRLSGKAERPLIDITEIKNDKMIYKGDHYEIIKLEKPIPSDSPELDEAWITHMIKGFDEDIYIKRESNEEDSLLSVQEKIFDDHFIHVKNNKTEKKALDVMVQFLKKNTNPN